MKRRLHESLRRVQPLPRYDRPIDAVNLISAACANSTVRGVMVVLVDHHGDTELSVFGKVRRGDLCFAGTLLQNEAVR